MGNQLIWTMKFDQLQLDVFERLSANTLLTSVETFIEFDPRKTPAELEAQDEAFQRALITRGLALVILSPFGRPTDAVRRAVAWAMTVPIAVVENVEVNRGVPDLTAVPPRTPASLAPLIVQQEIIRALLPGAYRFPGEAALERPAIGADGLVHHYLLPVCEVVVS